jgi:hypothetical protein
MIERETVVPAERALVSAVIYNRLEADMPLGIDATCATASAFPVRARSRRRISPAARRTTRAASRGCLDADREPRAASMWPPRTQRTSALLRP